MSEDSGSDSIEPGAGRQSAGLPVPLPARPSPSADAVEAVPFTTRGIPPVAAGRMPPTETRGLPFDPWRLAGALRRRWSWVLAGTCLVAVIAGSIGHWRADYLVRTTLTTRDLSTRFAGSSLEGASYRPSQLSGGTLVNFLTSPELLGYVGMNANPPLSERALYSMLEVRPLPGSETIQLTLSGRDAGGLVNLANLYTSAAVQRSRAAQQEDPGAVLNNFNQKLAELDRQEADLNQKLAAVRTDSGMVDPTVEEPALEKAWVDLRVKIDMARGELALLESRNTLLLAEPLRRGLQDAGDRLRALQAQGKRDEHPDVKRVKDEITQLSRQLAEFGNGGGVPAAESIYAGQITLLAEQKKTAEAGVRQLEEQAAVLKQRLDGAYEHAGEAGRLKAELARVESYKTTLNNRRFEAQQYFDTAGGYYRLAPAPATLADVDAGARQQQAAVWGLGGGVVGFATSLGLVFLLELGDLRLKTASDVTRVTRLPVLAGLGNLDELDAAARKAWAFRTWTILAGTLGRSGSPGIVCGFISASAGEGRSTWVDLLAGAARERGCQVTKVNFDRAGKNVVEARDDQGSVPRETDQSALATREGGRELATVPGGPEAVVQIQLPGHVWNLERRKEFQHEVEKWREVSQGVILVDLPPASVPEAILLAENLPQLIWLADSGKSQARETRLHLETLHHGRCNLTGAVLNHAPEPVINL